MEQITASNEINDITPQLREDMIHAVQWLVRGAVKDGATIDEKRLSWEIIRTIRAELRETRGASGSDLAKAVSGLLPNVNIQVNVDNRDRLAHKAEHGLTRQVRERAAAQLAKLDAAAGRQPATTINAQVSAPASTNDDLIEAAAKPEGQRK